MFRGAPGSLILRSRRQMASASASSCHRALLYDAFGAPLEKLKLDDDFNCIPHPCSAASVAVKFLASPINPSDINQIEGSYPLKPESFPAIGGNEGVAEVVEVGAAVEGINVGDWVIPIKPLLGCWRESAVVDASDVIVVPKSVPLEFAAGLKVNPPTAYRLLTDFLPLKAGDVVIQNGANSVVGRFVIQMAALRGIHTVNIIRDRPRFSDLANELRESAAPGAECLFVKAEDLGSASAAQVKEEITSKLRGNAPLLGFNCVGGMSVGEMARLMGPNATIVSYGAMSRRPITLPASPLIFSNLTLKGFWVSRWYSQAPRAEITHMLKEICDWHQRGQLRSIKSKFFDFSTQWRQAIQEATTPYHEAKCVLKMGEK